MPSHIDARARSQANQTAKRAKQLKKQKARLERTPTSEQRVAARQARVVLERQLAALNDEYKPQVDRLLHELREKRSNAWAEYDERVRLIRQATILDPAKA